MSKKRPKTSPADKAIILHRVLSGESTAAIATELGISAGTIRSWVSLHRKQAGEQAPPPGPPKRLGRDIRHHSVTSATPVKLVPEVDTKALSPLECLEHDLAMARRDYRQASTDKYMAVLPAMLKQIRALQERYETLKAGKKGDEFDGGSKLHVAGLAVRIMLVPEYVRAVQADERCMGIWKEAAARKGEEAQGL